MHTLKKRGCRETDSITVFSESPSFKSQISADYSEVFDLNFLTLNLRISPSSLSA